MINAQSNPNLRRLCLSAFVGLALYGQGALAQAQSVVDPRTTDIALKQGQEDQLKTFKQRSKVNYDAYILGPGDGLQIELLDLPELS